MAQVSSFLLSADDPGRYALSPTQILCQRLKKARQAFYYKVFQVPQGI
jgi:hypothetical protein